MKISHAVLTMFIFFFIMSAFSLPTIKQDDSPTAKPTLSLEETGADVLDITKFNTLHSPVNGSDNEYLILGRVPVADPSSVSQADLAPFLGRWEGYSFAPPIKKDRKLVMTITEIKETGGKLVAWTGTNLQFPDGTAEAHFRVVRDPDVKIEFQFTWSDGSQQVESFTYDKSKGMLLGRTVRKGSTEAIDQFELTREKTFYVYKDYSRYLTEKNITAQAWKDPSMQQISKGYMVYLPDGYTDDSKKEWPLIFFLHGSGDCGDNIQILANNSPFMYIRKTGPLPAIIAAPLLEAKNSLFPKEFMSGALDEVLGEYRVDKQRIYLTGLSLGGEAAYRFAALRPEAFAAVMPLCAFEVNTDAGFYKGLKDMPIRAIHGGDDTIVALSKGRKVADLVKEAGADITFTVLPGHDHDVWTDTYSDKASYDWMFQQHRP
jgi:predicted esterase